MKQKTCVVCQIIKKNDNNNSVNSDAHKCVYAYITKVAMA